LSLSSVPVRQPGQSTRRPQQSSYSFSCVRCRQTVRKTGENDAINSGGKFPQAIWGIAKHPQISSTFYSQDNLGKLMTIQGICNKWSKVIHQVQLSGPYMYRQFNIQQFYVVPTQCIYVFCVDLRTNSHYFPIQH
jgi:hypothetical protein